jgi:hypothetical protein
MEKDASCNGLADVILTFPVRIRDFSLIGVLES